MSKIAVRAAARYLQSQGGPPATGPGEVLEAVNGAQGVLHQVVRKHVVPDDVTPEERKKLAKILADVKAMYEKTEQLRLDMEDWLADYGEARRAG